VTRGEPAGNKGIPDVYWVDRCNPGMFAEEHVEHRLTGVDTGVAIRGDQPQVDRRRRLRLGGRRLWAGGIGAVFLF